MLFLLFALWLILSGRITWDVCLVGAAVSGLLYVFLRVFLGHTPGRERLIFRRGWYMLLYAFAILWEVLKANRAMLRIILNKRIPVHQSIVRVQVDLKTPFARVLLANSITLTPGTITVSADEDGYTVHCLSREMIDGIEDGRLVRLLRKMEA